MTTLIKLVLLPFIILLLAGAIAHALVQVFLDDLGGPGDGTGYT